MLKENAMSPQNIFSIFRGDNKTMFLRAVNTGCNSDPLDLTACTEIDIALPNADGTFTHLLLTLGKVVIGSPAILGKFSAPIASLVSAVLNPGELQSFDVTFTIGAEKITVRYFQALSVFEQG